MGLRWSLLEAVSMPFSGVQGSSKRGGVASLAPVPGRRRTAARISLLPSSPDLPAATRDRRTSALLDALYLMPRALSFSNLPPAP